MNRRQNLKKCTQKPRKLMGREEDHRKRVKV